MPQRYYGEGRWGTLSTSPVTIALKNTDLPVSVAVEPLGGESVTVEYKINDMSYQAWDYGVVSSFTIDILQSPVSYIRITSTGSTSKYGVY